MAKSGESARGEGPVAESVIIHRCSLKTNSTPPCVRTFRKNVGELTVVAYSVKRLEEG